MVKNLTENTNLSRVSRVAGVRVGRVVNVRIIQPDYEIRRSYVQSATHTLAYFQDKGVYCFTCRSIHKLGDLIHSLSY